VEEGSLLTDWCQTARAGALYGGSSRGDKERMPSEPWWFATALEVRPSSQFFVILRFEDIISAPPVIIFP